MAISRQPDYSDLDLDFIAHPATGDIVKKIGPDAIKRSVRNLILTNFYDRPFRPGIGSNVQKFLFENPNPLTVNFLKDAIAEVLRSLLPALDDLERAEAHGDLEGSPFAAVTTKLRSAGEKFGLKRFGEKGEKFNPELHNALVQTPSGEVTEAVIADVVEPGFMIDDRLLRPAMVSVFVPEES